LIVTKFIQHRNILPPARRGSRRDSFVEEGSVYNADVVIGESIRIFGKKRNGQEITGKRVWSGAGFWSQDHGDWIETVQDHPELIAILSARDAGDPSYVKGMVGDWCIEHGADASLPFDSLNLVNTYIPKYEEFDRTFYIGDRAVEGSYNLIYIRPITKIAAKTVTVEMYSEETRRMSLYEFCWRNWDYNAERIQNHNQIESMNI
jgi:hypothetical protein